MRPGIRNRDRLCSIRSPIGMTQLVGAVGDTLMKRLEGEKVGHLGVEADRYSAYTVLYFYNRLVV